MAKAKKLDLDVTPAQEEPKQKYKFVFPYWSNKDAKHIIVTLEYGLSIGAALPFALGLNLFIIIFFPQYASFTNNLSISY